MAPKKIFKTFIDPIYGVEPLNTFEAHRIKLEGTDWQVESHDYPELNEFTLICSSASHRFTLVFSSVEQRRIAAENMFPNKPLYMPKGEVLAEVVERNLYTKPKPLLTKVNVGVAAAGVVVGVAAFLGVKKWIGRG